MNDQHWLYELIDGLARYEAEHAKDGGCLGHLMKLVPEDLAAESAAYMRGWKAAEEASELPRLRSQRAAVLALCDAMAGPFSVELISADEVRAIYGEAK